MMKEGNQWHKYQKDIPKIVNDFALSEKFNWTPNQIDEIDPHKKRCYLCLIKGEGESKKYDTIA